MYKTVATCSKALYLELFNRKPSVEVHNVEKETAYFVARFPVKGKIILSALGAPFLDHVLTYNTFFEHTRIHLILSDLMSSTDV